MSGERHHADHELGRGDAELVRRIAESYRPPEPAASARAAFRARLDARIRRRAVGRRWAAGAATAAAAVAIVWLRGSLPMDAPAPDATSDEALLALALPAASEEEVLPADYQAIEDLLLEGEGV
jgi:ferric-dicitrate binding protein FerR (iron transport regulator)